MRILPRMARDPEARVASVVTAIALELGLAASDRVRAQYADWLEHTMGLSVAAPQQAGSIEEFFRDKGARQ